MRGRQGGGRIDIRSERIPKPIAALARLKEDPKNCPSPVCSSTKKSSPRKLVPPPSPFIIVDVVEEEARGRRAVEEELRLRRAEDSLSWRGRGEWIDQLAAIHVEYKKRRREVVGSCAANDLLQEIVVVFSHF